MRLGIAGKIAAGKSVIANYLANRGWRAVNADELGHRALLDDSVKQALVERFGAGLLAGQEIDRARLAAAALAAPQGMAFLNGLLWPRIDEMIRGELSAAAGHSVLEAAVMLEAGWARHVDLVLLVRAPRELRLARAKGDRALLEKLADLQDAYPAMERGADHVIENDGDEAALIEQLRRIPEVSACLR